MRVLLPPTGVACPDRPTQEDLRVLLANARAFAQGADAGWTVALLRGKHLAVLCESDQSADAQQFRLAAEALGARVAHVCPRISEHSENRTLLQTARLMGRLYDAVECQGLPTALVRRLAAESGVPFYDGLACAGHATAPLTAQFGNAVAPEQNRRWVVQAVLAATIGRLH